MTVDEMLIGTVVSDAETPTFEAVRVELKAGNDMHPNTLVRIPVSRSKPAALIGRVRTAHEHNPNEAAGAIHLRDTLVMGPITRRKKIAQRYLESLKRN